MSPLHLKIMLHYHCTEDDFPDLHIPDRLGFCEDLVLSGYLKKKSVTQPVSRFAATEKLNFFVDYICSLPEPKQIWQMPMTDK